MKIQHYALTTTLSPLLLLAIVALANWWIDPYQIFSADRQGVYANKPALHANMRLHKAVQIRLQKPDTLILGTSKAIQGVPTEHALFADGRVYNLAMPLASMKELTYLLRHANAQNATRTVILALDFLSFNALARTDGPAAGFQTDRLSGHAESWASHAPDYLAALISLDALIASAKVLKTARRALLEDSDRTVPVHRVMTGLGGRRDAEIRSRLSDGGHRSNTLKIEEFFTNAVYLPAPHRQFSFTSDEQDSLFWFEQFLRTLHQEKIEAFLFISPSHARLNELIHAAGLWPQFEQWKLRLLALTRLVAQEANQPAYALWDFSAPSDVTTEPFPEAGNSDYRMRYYYESIHFNQETGKRVLDRLQGHNVTNNTGNMALPSFGHILTTKNIDQTLRLNRQQQQRFREQFPDYNRELDTIVSGR